MTITAISIPSGPIQVSALPVDYQWRGNWNQTTTYIINDKVFRGVSTWRAVAVNTNDDPVATPPSGAWTLVALGLDPTVLNASAAIATNAATQAAASATQAAASATLAAAQISGSAAYATLSQTAAQQSQAATVQAQTAAGASLTSASLAQAWAMQVSGTVGGTIYYSASYYATAAASSASAAAGSASGAATSATSAGASASTSAAWAMQSSGTVDGTYYSARQYAMQAQASAQSAAAGGVAPTGTFTVGNLVVANTTSGSQVKDGGRPGWVVLDNPTIPYQSVDRDEVWWTTANLTPTQNLPASPAVGMRIRAMRSGANPVTVGANGNTINGIAADLVLDIDKMGAELVWDVANTTWNIIHMRRA